MVSQANLVSLAGLFEELQESRQNIKSQELEYNEAEDAVAKEEYSLEQEERYFHDTYVIGMIPDDDAASEAASISLTPAHPPVLETSPPNIPDPLDDYHTKVGDANILREKLEELTSERDEYAQERARLELMGLQMGTPYLKFLDSYDEVYNNYFTELAATELDIQKLEGPAIETGHLDPSTAYSNIHSLVSERLVRGYQMVGQGAKPATDLPVEEMNIKFHGTGTTLVDKRYTDVGTSAHHTRSPRANIYGWLKGLPKSSRKAGNFASHENSWMRGIQYCATWVAGRLRKNTSGETVLVPAEGSARSQHEQLQHNYVDIVPNFWSRPCSPTDLAITVRALSMEERRPDPEIAPDETMPDLDIDATSRAPNASYSTPFYDLEPGVNDCGSHSI